MRYWGTFAAPSPDTPGIPDLPVAAARFLSPVWRLTPACTPACQRPGRCGWGGPAGLARGSQSRPWCELCLSCPCEQWVVSLGPARVTCCLSLLPQPTASVSW